MESGTISEMQQRLAELQAIFRQQLPDRLNEIKSGWQQLCGKWEGEKLGQLHQMCHSLAGSGGTFGAYEVGWAARTLEQSLKALQGSGQRPDEATVQQIQEQLSALIILSESWMTSVQGGAKCKG